MVKHLLLGFFFLTLFNSSPAISVPNERVMAPGMWHSVMTGEPLEGPHITESAYIVLADDKAGRASFELALIPKDDVLMKLGSFQMTTQIKSGKGVAVFNVKGTQLDQWISPKENNGKNFVANQVKGQREGLLTCLFAGAVKDKPGEIPPPHCHAMIAGFDQFDLSKSLEGGFGAVGGHFGGAIVNVVLEMSIDTFPSVIEKEDGGDLGGEILSISREQDRAARALLHPDNIDSINVGVP